MKLGNRYVSSCGWYTYVVCGVWDGFVSLNVETSGGNYIIKKSNSVVLEGLASGFLMERLDPRLELKKKLINDK